MFYASPYVHISNDHDSVRQQDTYFQTVCVRDPGQTARAIFESGQIALEKNGRSFPLRFHQGGALPGCFRGELAQGKACSETAESPEVGQGH